MKKLSNRKGFTLVEVIIAVAVVAILTAVTVPSLVNTNKALTTQQGNDYAKEIFLAVEHNLTAKKSSGNVPGVGASVYNEDETALLSDVEKLLKGNTDKRDELFNNDTERQYKYISSGDEGFNEILPADSIDSTILDGTSVTIIFNPVSASAFYVKYGDTGEYYGTVISLVCSQYEDPEPVVVLDNGEENMVTITVPVPEDYESNKTAYFNAITYKITVTEAGNKNNWFSYSYNISDSDCTEDGFSFDYVNQQASWALDSLVLGRSFSDRNLGTTSKSNSAIQPGKDIEVEVTYSFDTPEGCRKIEFDRSSSITDGNSLFESYDETSGTITVSNGRNLQNLNSIDEKLAKTLAEKGGTVKLGDNIHWEYTVSHYSTLTGGAKYYSALAASTVFQRFIPLKAEKLFAYGSKVTVDGCNKYISYLYINEQDNDAGMFENLLVNVSNLSMVDPIVKTNSNEGGSAGALAAISGYVTDDNGVQLECDPKIEISNCSVVLKHENGTTGTGDVYGAGSASHGSVGLLIGGAYYTKISGCTGEGQSDAVVDTGGYTVPASGDNFGLLAGYAENCVIGGAEGAYLKVSGNVDGGSCSQLGGIVGCTQGTGMTISYTEASGSLTGVSASNIGGAVGLVWDGSYSNVTADMNISGIDYTNATEYDELNCPSKLGTIGKFVGFIGCGDYDDTVEKGYVAGGSFTNCSGTGESDKAYQFLGVVKYLTLELDGDYYSSDVQYKSDSISATRDKDTSGNYENSYTAASPSMHFYPVINYAVYPISEFEGNTYFNGTETKKQYIANDSFYDRTWVDDTYTITENKDENGNIKGPEDNKKYLIRSTTDSSFFSAKKDVIPAGVIAQAVANKSVHIAEWPSFTASGFNLEVYGTLTGGYGMWSNKHDSEYDLFSYYYSSATDAPYNSETLDTSADLYRFVTESKDLEVENADGTTRTLEIKDGTELTLDEFRACKQSIWQWDTESDNVNTLAFVDYDNDKKLAYMFIDAWYAKDGIFVSAKQETPALIADGNKWLSDKSPVDMSYEIRNGGITFYRAQYYSVGWMVSFLVKKGETGLDGAYSRSNFDDSCYVTLFNIEDPTYDGTFKYLNDIYTQRMTTD